MLFYPPSQWCLLVFFWSKHHRLWLLPLCSTNRICTFGLEQHRSIIYTRTVEADSSFTVPLSIQQLSHITVSVLHTSSPSSLRYSCCLCFSCLLHTKNFLTLLIISWPGTENTKISKKTCLQESPCSHLGTCAQWQQEATADKQFQLSPGMKHTWYRSTI